MGLRHDFGGGGGGGGGRQVASQFSTGRLSSSPSWIIFCRASSTVHTLQNRVSVTTGTMAGVGSSVLSSRPVIVYVLPVTLTVTRMRWLTSRSCPKRLMQIEPSHFC